MLRNYLAAALRNMVRNRLYAVVNIVGLAAAFAAVLLIALFIRDELTYERWMPGSERVFMFTERVSFTNGNPTLFPDSVSRNLAEWMMADVPEIEGATRLHNAPMAQAPIAGFRRGDVEADERLYWADPNALQVLPFPIVAGDPRTALEMPGAIVITRSMARKYFDRDDPIGETLEMDRTHAMTVTAVIEDLPSNTHFNFSVLASGRATFSDLALLDAGKGRGAPTAFTYVRLKDGVDPAILQAAWPGVLDRHGLTERFAKQKQDHGVDESYALRPIAEMHLSPGSAPWLQKPRGNPQTARSLSIVALCLTVLACVNFASLTTARAAQRAVEIGVRKVSGAFRFDLALQFIGESLLTTAIAMAVAATSVSLLVPRLNAFLTRDSISFNIASDGSIALAIIGTTVLVGILAGLYPALVLPSFKVAAIVKGSAASGAGSSRLRQAGVVFQFAVLISLIVTSVIVYRQTRFAFDEGMRLDTAQVLLARTNCTTTFKEEVVKLPGVVAAACSSNMALNYEWGQFSTKRADGTTIDIDDAMVGIGFLELYGVKPVAGRLFQSENAMDTSEAPRTLVLNEAAVRALGFESNAAALGQSVEWIVSPRQGPERFQKGSYQVVGVVPDLWLDAVHEQIRPVAYAPNPAGYQIMSIKLDGTSIPETLAAIDRLWTTAGEPKPLTRFFLDQRVQELYLDITRQSQFFAIFSAVAIVIAAMGLFALSAFTAELRTKEIGIRKSMGATRTDILRLLLWQFTQPVLWANLIAWPAAYLLMRRWLEGFAYHIEIAPWMFLAASGAALLIAVATVIGHALLVARAAPVTALRYE